MTQYNDKLDYDISAEAPEETLDVLLAEYLGEEAAQELKESLQALIEAQAFMMAGEFIRRLTLRLRETKYGTALARAMGLGGQDTIEEASRDFLMSPQYLSRIQKECERLLGPNLKVDSLETKTREPATEEGWLDINGAASLMRLPRKVTRLRLQKAQVTMKVGLYGTHLFNEEEVRRLSDEQIN